MIDVDSLFPLTLQDFEEAARRLDGLLVRTPLAQFAGLAPSRSLWLKMETEQVGGSTKVRGALNAALALPPRDLEGGLVTVSSGNMGRAVAWTAQTLGTKATVGIPSTAPDIKVEAIAGMGAEIVLMSPEDWWTALCVSRIPGVGGTFIHPVLNRGVLAGAGTIAMEMLDDGLDVSAIYVPFGGGALALATAQVTRLRPRDIAVVACEPASKAPLTASFRAKAETVVEPQPSIVDAAGAPRLLPGLWPYLRDLVSRAIAVPDVATRDAIRRLATNADTVAEGAGALSLAGALSDSDLRPAACVITGRNIDPDLHAQILRG